jgi:ABC-2 type transport system ATP-binding protein
MHRGRVVVSGTPSGLKAGVGDAASLDDVFVHYTGGVLEERGTYRDVARARDTARRLE